MTNTAIKVLIIADDPLARTGLAAILENHTVCLVVGSLPSDELSEDTLDVYLPDIILWDMGWEQSYTQPSETISDLEIISDLVQDGIALVVLIADESQVYDVWRMGARGLLDRDVSEIELIAALQAVYEGLIVTKPELAPRIFPPTGGLDLSPMEPLTSREIEVIQLVAEGLPNKTIALRLELSEHTVKFHVNTILRKLGAQSRTEAVVRAYRLGIILI